MKCWCVMRTIGVIGLGMVVLGWISACDKSKSSLPEETLSVDVPCDATGQGCNAQSGAMQWTVRIGPEAVALKSFPVSLRIAGSDETLESARVKFVMSGMSMGLNEYQLISVDNNAWEADVMLPICTSGRSDWLAEFSVASKRKRWRLVVPFVLRPPGH
jgi:hypothetical protein